MKLVICPKLLVTNKVEFINYYEAPKKIYIHGDKGSTALLSSYFDIDELTKSNYSLTRKKGLSDELVQAIVKVVNKHKLKLLLES